MLTPLRSTQLVFVCDFSEREAAEARDRGCLSHVLVEINGDRLYPVFFYDAIRLGQDLSTSAEHGEPFVAETGMIVLTEVTIEAMESAVERLFHHGFFNYLTPISRDRLASADPYCWPP
jgi:hypothetical protein